MEDPEEMKRIIIARLEEWNFEPEQLQRMIDITEE